MMDTQVVTLELPKSLFRVARQVADVTGQSVESVLQASIAHALPPLDDVPPDEAAELAALALLGDANLWQVARAIMPAEDQTEVHALLDCQGAGELTPVEHSRLQALMEIYGRITVRKAHASLLPARRGYRVAMQEQPT
jgi:hypothetical protein